MPNVAAPDDSGYLTRQLLTYIGNKRALLAPIGEAIEQVKARLDKPKLRILDGFSGSGVVSRYLKAHASELVANDIENYARVVSECYLANRSEISFDLLDETIARLNASVDDTPIEPGFIERLYAPRDEGAIASDDRVFYTRTNARRLDNYRRLIETAPPEIRPLLLGPLLSEASVHANTAGIFKGFYKDRDTGLGKFGGKGSDSLSRILGAIWLESPVLSRYECDYEVHQADMNSLTEKVVDLDVAYFDPPYNQHPYGSNYFMLNLLADYREPAEVSRVSGIPVDWQRSDYNVRALAFARLEQLIRDVDAKFVLLSFNDEGYVRPEELRELLASIGRVDVIDVKYNTFRGSRNLGNRGIHVTEHLFLTEKR